MKFLRLMCLLLLLVYTNGCAVGMQPVIPPIVPQRHAQDCMVAALAMWGGWDYETVDAARQKLGIQFDKGLSLTASVSIAKSLGERLKVVTGGQTYNPITTEGILVIGEAGQYPLHAVYTTRGLIYDPQYVMPRPHQLFWQDHSETFVFYVLPRR
jgi:hypothetical protein